MIPDINKHLQGEIQNNKMEHTCININSYLHFFKYWGLTPTCYASTLPVNYTSVHVFKLFNVKRKIYV